MTPQTERTGLFASAVENPAGPGTARLEERPGDPLDLVLTHTPSMERLLLYWWYYAWFKGVFAAGGGELIPLSMEK